MSTMTRINSDLVTPTRRPGGHFRRHRLPLCEATGLARYRDRHQARHGAKSLAESSRNRHVNTFACPDCRGYHLEKTHTHEPIVVDRFVEPTMALTTSLEPRERRYVLFDVENPTCGAKATPEQLAQFWGVLKQHAPGIAPHDHVVVGASRRVARKYRPAIHGPNVKWVVGADAPDGADRALLAAIDLRRVARDYDELVIISGDHAFAGLARQARLHGLRVHVVTAQHPEHGTMLSRELAGVANARTLVRLESRTLTRTNNARITQVASGMHRSVQPNPVAA